MAGQQIVLRCADPDGKSADIAVLCQSIKWGGDYRNAARTLSFSPAVPEPGSTLIPTAPTELGGSVEFAVDGQALMTAYKTERTRDSLGHTVDVTAYDGGLYLTRNSKFMRSQGQTPEAVTSALCREFGIQTGSLAKTGVAVTRNFLGVNLYKIIMTMYTQASEKNGKKYRVRFRGRQLEVVEMAVSAESLRLEPGSNLLSCVTKESVTKMVNSVAIYNDDCKLIRVKEDADARRLYGLMQTAVKESAHDDINAWAAKQLKDNGLQTTISLTCTGDTRLITGNTVVVREPVTGTNGLFWIISDDHTWQRGVYQTKVTLSLEALMDEQTAGSAPSKK